MAPRRGRKIAAIAASALAHAALLAVLATYAPRLVIPSEPGGPPEPVIPLLLTPRAPPSAAAARGARPGVIRLHRRQLRITPFETTVEPLPVPPVPPPAAPPSPAPAAPARRPALPEGPREQLSAALRRSAIGCANAAAAGLTREERTACEERFGVGAASAAYLPADASLPADKRALLQGAAQRREADYRYKHGGVPLGLSGGGGTAEDLARTLGNDRPKATVPF